MSIFESNAYVGPETLLKGIKPDPRMQDLLPEPLLFGPYEVGNEIQFVYPPTRHTVSALIQRNHEFPFLQVLVRDLKEVFIVKVIPSIDGTCDQIALVQDDKRIKYLEKTIKDLSKEEHLLPYGIDTVTLVTEPEKTSKKSSQKHIPAFRTAKRRPNQQEFDSYLMAFAAQAKAALSNLLEEEGIHIEDSANDFPDALILISDILEPIAYLPSWFKGLDGDSAYSKLYEDLRNRTHIFYEHAKASTTFKQLFNIFEEMGVLGASLTKKHAPTREVQVSRPQEERIDEMQDPTQDLLDEVPADNLGPDDFEEAQDEGEVFDDFAEDEPAADFEDSPPEMNNNTVDDKEITSAFRLTANDALTEKYLNDIESGNTFSVDSEECEDSPNERDRAYLSDGQVDDIYRDVAILSNHVSSLRELANKAKDGDFTSIASNYSTLVAKIVARCKNIVSENKLSLLSNMLDDEAIFPEPPTAKNLKAFINAVTASATEDSPKALGNEENINDFHFAVQAMFSSMNKMYT